MIDGTVGTLGGRGLPSRGSGVFRTQSAARGSLSRLPSQAAPHCQEQPARSPSEAVVGREPAETAAVCPRPPQPLPLLKRQRFELARRPVSPYSPARLLAAPGLHQRIRQGRTRLQRQGSSPRSARGPGRPNPAEMLLGALGASRRCQGPSAAPLCPDGSSAELIPGDALPPPWPRLVQPRSKGAGELPTHHGVFLEKLWWGANCPAARGHMVTSCPSSLAPCQGHPCRAPRPVFASSPERVRHCQGCSGAGLCVQGPQPSLSPPSLWRLLPSSALSSPS